MTEREQNIWITGIFDGSANIWINRVKGKYTVSILFSRRLGEKIIKFLQSRYGGHIERKGLMLGGYGARKVIEEIGVHLVRLRPHAELLKEFWKTMDDYETNYPRGSTLPEEIVRQRADIWARMQELNKSDNPLSKG